MTRSLQAVAAGVLLSVLCSCVTTGTRAAGTQRPHPADSNGDGIVTESELEAYKRKLEADRERWKATSDKIGDIRDLIPGRLIR